MSLKFYQRGLLFFSAILFSVLACGRQAPAIIPSPVFISYTPTSVTSPTLVPSAPTMVAAEKRIGASVPQSLREQVNNLDVGFTLDISATSESVSNLIQWV